MKPRNTKKCSKCNRKISLSNFSKHEKSCRNHTRIVIIKEEWKQKNEKYKCPYCKKEYPKMGIATHIWRKHIENDKKWGGSEKGYWSGNEKVAWNKGLTKETDERVKQCASTYSKRFKEGKINGWNGKKHSKETKEKISKKLSLNNKGGRCKWYEVERTDGTKFKVQGTWEVRFSKVLNIIDEEWIKIGIGNQKHSFKWIDDNREEHTYSPDFWSPKLNKYFEVKGYWWGEDERKMELVIQQNKVKIEIIKKKQLIEYEKLLS